MAVTTVPCTICGADTEMTGTGLCDACWEVNHRMDDFMRRASSEYLVGLARGALLRLDADDRLKALYDICQNCGAIDPTNRCQCRR